MARIFLLITSIIILLILFGSIVIHPNDYILYGYSDGLKNYFTASYYINNDNNFHFSGLQYPYGTHIVYTDNQPIISFILNKVQHITNYNISDYTIGIFNSLIFISIIIGIQFQYSIFKKFNLKSFYAAVFSLLIILFSPQMIRVNGHYALSYVCVIPIIWYILLNIEHLNGIKGFVIHFTTNFIIAFLHPYYLLISISFYLSYIFCHFLFNKKYLSQYKNQYITAISAIVIALISVQALIKITDPITDRPSSPYGIFSYRAVFEGLFLPNHGYIHNLISPLLDNNIARLFLDLKYQSIESSSYVGIAGLVFLIVLYKKLFSIIKTKNWKKLKLPFYDRHMAISFYASILVLLFAMAYPFRLEMEFILDWIPPLRQFRSLGRFAWVFYYIYMTALCYYIYLVVKKWSGNTLKIVLFIGTITLLYSFEFHEYYQSFKPNPINNLLQKNSTFFPQLPINPKNYCAIVSLPIYIAGTEKVDKDTYGEVKMMTMFYAYKYSIPSISGDLSRSSALYGHNILQLASHPLIKKGIFDALPNDSILVIVNSKKCHFNEINLLKSITPITSIQDSFIIGRTTKSLWITSQKTYLDSMITSCGSNNIYHRTSFDNNPQSTTFMGAGSMELTKESPDLTLKIPAKLIGQNVALSFWTRLDYSTSDNNEFTCIQSNQSPLYFYTSNAVDFYKGWARISFQIKNVDTNVTIHLNNKKALIDEVFIELLNEPTISQTPFPNISNYPLE